MKTYLSIFKLKFINGIQYRMAAIAGLLTQLFFGFIFISVYLAFYETNGESSLPMKWQELVDYLWLNQAFFALVYTWFKDNELLSMIKNGNIAYEFVRPINFYKKWFATMYGTRLSNVLLRFLPVILVSLLLPYPYKLGLPINITSFILFIISLVISSLVITSFTMIYHLITIYTLDEKGIMSLFMVSAEIFSGGTVPISFFPPFLQTIANILPFRYICDLPFRIYSGNISIIEALPNILYGIIWLIILLLIGYLLAQKSTRKALIQGG